MAEPQFRPMKGAKVEDSDLHLLFQYASAYWVSAKLDGIRCLVRGGKALSASLKPIPNRFVRSVLERPEYEGFDGELLLAERSEFNQISSAIMSEDGEPDFVFHVFDVHDVDHCFETRLCFLRNAVLPPRAKLVGHIKCESLDQLQAVESVALSRGYEGVMLRRGDLPYKFGKASIKQGHLLKRKPMAEAEAIIVGFEEGEENQNEATTDERGLTKRSSAKAGKVPNGTLGKLLVRNKRFGDFKIGTGEGLTHAMRERIWNQQAGYLGSIVRFKFQEMGTVDKPRLPIYLSFRDERDMEPELVQELRSLV